MCLQRLGNNYLASQPPEVQASILSEMYSQKIADVDGINAWNGLSDEEYMKMDTNAAHQLYRCLGDEVYKTMPVDAQHSYDLFLWVGCCMHKELNSVKDGSVMMTAWWAKNGVKGPILLANKDNDATLNGVPLTVESLENLLPVQLCALMISGAEGVKLAALLGALLNHKNNKKGQYEAF